MRWYCTCEGYGKEVAGGDGEADGEGCTPLHIWGVVVVSSRGKDRENQHHRDQELDAHSLNIKKGVYM